MEFPLLVAILFLSFLAGFCFGCLFCFFVLFWFVLSLMGLLTGLCIGPLPALLRLLILLTALQANYNSACLLRLNVCNDLAKAMKALDGKRKRVSVSRFSTDSTPSSMQNHHWQSCSFDTCRKVDSTLNTANLQLRHEKQFHWLKKCLQTSSKTSEISVSSVKLVEKLENISEIKGLSTKDWTP